MSDYIPPLLPEGDAWKVERISGEGAKTMRIIWHRYPRQQIATLPVLPTKWQKGFEDCYKLGLARLARDAIRIERDLANSLAFEQAQAAAELQP